VHDRALAVLEGNAREVAAGIRRQRANGNGTEQAEANKSRYVCDLPDQQGRVPGLPTSSGRRLASCQRVIEGTCRYLVADRMDITGARLSVEGAEAILRRRAVRANDDFAEYWKFHLNANGIVFTSPATPTA